MKQIDAEGIQLYPLPECDEDEDEDYKEQCRQLKVTFKFCNGQVDKKPDSKLFTSSFFTQSANFTDIFLCVILWCLGFENSSSVNNYFHSQILLFG